jgi:NAD(P)-dependent dehydrogenase (short-subunit alcohol dehydrogenase family)
MRKRKVKNMDNTLFSVEDRTIVVTGGMGQLGKQFSLSLLRNGARIAILDSAVGKQELPEVFREFQESNNLLLITCDVTQRKSIEEALVKILNNWNVVPYGLINNAALDSPPNAPPEETGHFENYPADSWDKVMDVNIKGSFQACQVFGAVMAKAGRGSIINIGSTYGIVSPDHRIYDYKRKKVGVPFFKPVAYSASKSALVNFTKYLAVYWSKSGVRTNLMVLGGVYNNQDKEFLKGYCSRVPIGRMANEDEYNGTVIYLMSDASTYMTGATIMLDGGWTAW